MIAESKGAEKFSPEETQLRFEAALRGARIAGSKPMTGEPKKPARRKRKKKDAGVGKPQRHST